MSAPWALHVLHGLVEARLAARAEHGAERLAEQAHVGAEGGLQVVIGGLVTSTALTLFVLPALYAWAMKREDVVEPRADAQPPV